MPSPLSRRELIEQGDVQLGDRVARHIGRAGAGGEHADGPALVLGHADLVVAQGTQHQGPHLGPSRERLLAPLP